MIADVGKGWGWDWEWQGKAMEGVLCILAQLVLILGRQLVAASLSIPPFLSSPNPKAIPCWSLRHNFLGGCAEAAEGKLRS